MTVFPLTGGCNCGAVRFEMTAPLTRASYCHCKRCQRRRAADHLDQVMRSRLTGRNPAHGPTKLRPATKGASMTTTTPESTITELEDRLAIIELIGRLSLSIDAKHWDAMARLFTDTVYHDRTSLTGGEPYTAPVAQFVEGWRQTLQALDAIHHQITNHVVSLDGDEATCTANMQGTHVLANASGGPMWTVGGRHIYQLKRTPDGWRISGLTFNLQWATGNMNVLTLSMAAGA